MLANSTPSSNDDLGSGSSDGEDDDDDDGSSTSSLHPTTTNNTPGLSDYKLLRLQKIFSGILWGKVDGPAWDYVALPARIVIAAGSNEKHLQKKAANANTRRNNNATHAKKIMELPLGLLLLLRYYYLLLLDCLPRSLFRPKFTIANPKTVV